MLGAQDRARALNSQPDRWLVQGGLPLEPKHRNGGLVDVLAGEEVFDRFGMHADLMTKESASDSTPDCAVRSVSVARYPVSPKAYTFAVDQSAPHRHRQATVQLISPIGPIPVSAQLFV